MSSIWQGLTLLTQFATLSITHIMYFIWLTEPCAIFSIIVFKTVDIVQDIKPERDKTLTRSLTTNIKFILKINMIIKTNCISLHCDEFENYTVSYKINVGFF